ncbi:MAG: class I SAM-dependent methyltransferase [Dehalococcoidales bacterium]|nr:class I SAM-dependent methyltransferase [Dehalococcoidales bacterium]
MFEFESFLQDKLNPIYRAHYSIWVHWWPWWRKNVSGQAILRKWQDINLVQEGHTFLDYGCGTGSFTIPAARIIGARGKVYALDCFPRQLEMVTEQSQKEGLNNIETILSSSHTGLPDGSIDTIWMCDVLHEIKERESLLRELHRVLKKDGVLVIYDGMRSKMLEYADGLFSLESKTGKLYKFVK